MNSVQKIIKYFGENDIPDTEEIVSYLKSHRVGVFNYYWADKHIYTVNRIKLDKSNGLYFTVLYGRDVVTGNCTDNADSGRNSKKPIKLCQKEFEKRIGGLHK